MTMHELSQQYADSAALLHRRIRHLQQLSRATADAAAQQQLRRRIAALRPLLQQCRQLQHLTAHYYERSFHRDAHYTL